MLNEANQDKVIDRIRDPLPEVSAFAADPR